MIEFVRDAFASVPLWIWLLCLIWAVGFMLFRVRGK